MLALGIALTILSFVFFVFPGGALANKPLGKDSNHEFWKNAPGLHKAMWIIWGVVSIAVAVFALISFDPDFFK